MSVASHHSHLFFRTNYISTIKNSVITNDGGDMLMRGLEGHALHGIGDIGVGLWGTWQTPRILDYLRIPVTSPVHWPNFASAENRPKWHQMGAVLFMIQAAFTPEITLIRRGCLLTDDVGIGKTTSVLAFIGYFAYLVTLGNHSEAAQNPIPYAIREYYIYVYIFTHLTEHFILLAL
jgi:hypothetical protein